MKLLAAVAAMVVLGTPIAHAHFQTLYAPETLLDKGGSITLSMVFTHPFSAEHTLGISKPERLIVVHKQETKDLTANLKAVTWQSLQSADTAYQADVKLRSMGDYVFALTPAPYHEKSEDIYIQQFTKAIVNVGGLPTDWDAEVGLPAEIVPLDKPYALYAGGTFSGIVKSAGKPVPFAEIEVEYLNHPPVSGQLAFQKAALMHAPHPVYGTITIKADAFGKFVFGVPKAGTWGFCALGVGPETEHLGKELSQDAVLWVHARDVR